MIILVDADGVLENLTEVFPELINKKYGTDVKYEDITEWGFEKYFPNLTYEEVYSTEFDPELYERTKPKKDAPEILKKLIDDGHEIYVVTNTKYKAVELKMEKVMKKYFPFLSWKNFIITSNKQMIKGDVLIDDGVHNLIGGDYAKILFEAPWNRDFDTEANGMFRAKNWEEIYNIINTMSKQRVFERSIT